MQFKLLVHNMNTMLITKPLTIFSILMKLHFVSLSIKLIGRLLSQNHLSLMSTISLTPPMIKFSYQILFLQTEGTTCSLFVSASVRHQDNHRHWCHSTPRADCREWPIMLTLPNSRCWSEKILPFISTFWPGGTKLWDCCESPEHKLKMVWVVHSCFLATDPCLAWAAWASGELWKYLATSCAQPEWDEAWRSEMIRRNEWTDHSLEHGWRVWWLVASQELSRKRNIRIFSWFIEKIENCSERSSAFPSYSIWILASWVRKINENSHGLQWTMMSPDEVEDNIPDVMSVGTSLLRCHPH